MTGIQTAPLLRGSATQSTAVDNATATATLAATPGVKRLILGVEAQYNVSENSIRTLTLNVDGSEVKNWEWDFTNGPFLFMFPVALHTDNNEAVTLVLEASGASSTFGDCTIWAASD